MKNIIFLIIFCLYLPGCVQQAITGEEVQLALDYCEDKEGLDEINENFLGGTFIICNDETRAFEGEVRENFYLKKINKGELNDR